MYKKLIVSILGILIISALTYCFLQVKVNRNKTVVAYGYSVNNSGKSAVKEAVSMFKKELKRPELIILFSTSGYNHSEILKEIADIFPGSKVYGGTSMQGVITKDGWHQGAKASLAMMAISSPKIEIGVGGAGLNDYVSAREAGKIAIQNAITNAGTETGFPNLVLITSSPGNEEAIIKGIEDVIGWGIPIIGGSSADDHVNGDWKQFCNDTVYSNGITLAAIFTDLTISWSYESGYDNLEESGIVTKAKDRIIYEIDGKPAAIVYNEWCNGCMSHKMETGGPIGFDNESVFWPLAKMITNKTGKYYLSIHPISIDAKDKSLSVLTNMYEGDYVLPIHADWPLLLNRAETTPKKAMESNRIRKDEALFGLYVFCAGIMHSIPEEQKSKIPQIVSATIGEKVPFIGYFTFGEQGPLGMVNHHGNLVNSTILFSESENK